MIPVIDLFAGPGGLGEGFSSLTDENGKPIFQIIMSVERDPSAHETLRLRSYVRKILRDDGTVPNVYLRYMRDHDDKAWSDLMAYRSEAWEAAKKEAVCATLVEGDDKLINEGKKRLEEWRAANGNKPLILIGGPPCQAYSLVGRSRRKHDTEFDKDVKQTLYKCYLSFINGLKPDIFVMENVKGLLSAKHKGSGVFDHIYQDMHDAGYEIHSLVKQKPGKPKDYVVEAERFGVPQMRHRVILLGVKQGSDRATSTLMPQHPVTLGMTLCGIPKVRSNFSERNKGWREMNWARYLDEAAKRIASSEDCKELAPIMQRVISSHPTKVSKKTKVTNEKGPYDEWYRLRFRHSKLLANHEARSHLAKDLDRYLFCSAYAEVHRTSARLEDFPDELLPNHKNVTDNIPEVKEGGEYEFNDRFRVQAEDSPSTTITSHIAKDGHYYIHPDPTQCRSLTVREAARLQTFPDDYLFEGNRTSQYTQVGNAVPPLLAQQIASVVASALGIEAKDYLKHISAQSSEGDDH
ncbi:DNA (cytosine-5)-methyltransferase 1 [Olsenella profusa DSM 13989]|uniref:DNA cytosine methyltransferase n=1 Tax=Olsenella profusa TaxID=138595 RepID=UPI002782DB1D|nr:DNA cytosine methyltransferase [Olsenella profusa]MDP9858306.1 DNA (cytosine-5)-methyltransferase 1 [Olsenella profusa DSM 13989]